MGKTDVGKAEACFKRPGPTGRRNPSDNGPPRSLAELGKRVDEQGRTLEEQARTLNEQQYVISQLVTYSMAEYIFKHLQHVYHGKRKHEGWPSEYLYRRDKPFERDLRFLRDHGFIGFIEIGSLSDGVDLVQALELTPVGKMCVRLREGMSKGRTPSSGQ